MKKHKFLSSSLHNYDSTLKHNMIFYIINGILFTMMMNLFKPFTVKFLYRLGGTDFQVSLLNALPGFIAVFTTIPGILLINKTKNKKKMMINFFFSSRVFLLFFIIIPFLPKLYQPIVFVILMTLKFFPESVSVTALQSFAGDIFPEKKRATAIASRNKFSVLAQLLTGLSLFFLLKYFNNQKDIILNIYQIFFFTAFILGMLEIYVFNKIKEKNYDSENNTSESINSKNSKLDFFKSFSQIPSIIDKTFKNKPYKNFIICSLMFHFGWQMGWPLFGIYQVKYLGADELWLIILNIISSIVMFFCYRFWNKMIDKKGNPPIMAVTTLGMAATPILFALSPNLYVLAAATIITGFFTSGTVTVILNSLLEVSPEQGRIYYVAVHVTLTNLTLCFSPILGNLILKYSNIYLALCTSAIFRLIGSFAFFIRNKNLNINMDTPANKD